MFSNDEMEMSFEGLLEEQPEIQASPLPEVPASSGIPGCDCGMWHQKREEHSLKCSFLWYLNLEAWREGVMS